MKTVVSPNRLIHEKSPYLLQHAYNPVDWYPWGEEAFTMARKEDKPIFLSIGYSTCHWCHVMEEESFENPEVAQVMNEYFVSIKVDREERPDLDHIYMSFVQATMGQGGWPMNVFLTPELKPFYGGTYFPPEDRWGRPGFVTLLKTVAGQWATEREKLIESSEEVTCALQQSFERGGEAQTVSVGQNTLRKGQDELVSQFDPLSGGFGNAPKFPRSHILSFLLRAWKHFGETRTLETVELTLSKMAKGGMYDQLGGGFHRYSVDSQWRVPHFEKMLYDQAILSRTYLEAYQATGKEEYAQVAREIFEYVLRDLKGQEGAFFSAEDADSAWDHDHPEEKSEGAFYIWEKKEIQAILGKDTAEIFNHFFGVEEKGNALSDPQGEFKGKNVLYLAHTLGETAQHFGKDLEGVKKVIEDSKTFLMAKRSKRLRPHLDDKILTDWNGLMISSLAFGSGVLREPLYLEAAKKAAEFILTEMLQEKGRLMHRYRDGDVAVKGFLEDYAFLSYGFSDLYEASFEPRYLEKARFLVQEMVRLFGDEVGGGFFHTAQDHEALILRTKDYYDGAIPSGNSVAALTLLRMGRLTMDHGMEKQARAIFDSFSDQLNQFPSAYPQMLIAVDFAMGSPLEGGQE